MNIHPSQGRTEPIPWFFRRPRHLVLRAVAQDTYGRPVITVTVDTGGIDAAAPQPRRASAELGPSHIT